MFLSVTGFELDLSQRRSDGVSPSREPRCVRARVVFSLGCCCVGNGSTSFSLPHLFPTPALLKLQTHLACFPPLSCHRWQTQRSALLYCQAFFFFFFFHSCFQTLCTGFRFPVMHPGIPSTSSPHFLLLLLLVSSFLLFFVSFHCTPMDPFLISQ